MPLKLSIITLCLDDPEGLEKTLRSCLPLREAAEFNFEHIVVDSSPLVHASIRSNPEFYATQWYEMPPKGIYPALNFGSHQAGGDIVWHLHSNDCLSNPRVLIEAMSTFDASSELQFLYSPVNYTRSNQFMFTRFQYHDFARNFYRFTPLDHQGVLFRKCFLQEMGYFSEEFKLAADYDLWVRALTLKVRTYYFAKVFADFDTSGRSNQFGHITCAEVGRIRKKLEIGFWGKFRNYLDFQYHSFRIQLLEPQLKRFGLYGVVRGIFLRMKRLQKA